MNIHDPAEGNEQPATGPTTVGLPGHRQQTDEEFAAFYRTQIRPLVGFLVNLGAGVQSAADIAQDVMTDAYRNWTGITHPKAWVYTAASRALVRKVASVEEPVEKVPEPTSLLPRPDAIAEWETRHDGILLVRTLPPRQRQVLAWSLAGFTPADIADRLGLTGETVRANLRKGRLALAGRRHTREEEQ
ncbi:RNA polymerase sigma factor [Streptomyces sp. MMBL 11-3]|uniref:RNA polymerase sigma factor n=1 Tax=Streptomyces sp. MMBL 11-3 TaxID=3382639 RepID=UPI0039B52280